jgi:hypothetical protein
MVSSAKVVKMLMPHATYKTSTEINPACSLRWIRTFTKTIGLNGAILRALHYLFALYLFATLAYTSDLDQWNKNITTAGGYSMPIDLTKGVLGVAACPPFSKKRMASTEVDPNR